MHKLTSIYSKKIRVIPNFKFNANNNISENKNHHDEFIMAYPAQFQIHKNHYALIQIHQTLLKLGVNLKTKLFGTDFNGHKEEIKDLINQYKLNKSIKIYGYLPSKEYIKEIVNSDAIIIPSSAEGGSFIFQEFKNYKINYLANNIKEIVMDSAKKVKRHINGIGDKRLTKFEKYFSTGSFGAVN